MSGPGDDLVSPPMNWGALLDQVIRDYNTEPAMGIVHALQKEAVQNSHGARDRQSRIPWSCNFRVLAAGQSVFLTVTDEGTYGLTGRAFPDSRDLPAALPATERLARFESMFDSGGGTGPGLFGRGKLVFNACSQRRLIYYDSLTREGQYRFGKREFRGRDCEQFHHVLEGDAARLRLQGETDGALAPLARPGTRITIVDPSKEVLESVESGELLNAIGGTWWEILQKEAGTITVAGRNGSVSPAHVPEEFGGLPLVSKNKWRVYRVDNQQIPVGDTNFKVKHLHILIPPQGHKIREENLGVFVHRRGMRVGRLQVAGIPDEVSDRLFGYVELDEAFEDVIAACENITHYGFSHTKRPEFRTLRKWVQDHFNGFMSSIGYGPKTDLNARSRQSAEEAQAELNSILKNLGVPNIGTGREIRREVSIAIENLEFPHGANKLSAGETLANFHFRVINRTDEVKDLRVEVFTATDSGELVETILPQSWIHLSPKQSKNTPPLQIRFDPARYSKGRFGCTAVVSSPTKGEVARRTFFVYLDVEPPAPEPELAEIELLDIEYPRENSRRVDFGQSILGLAYFLQNKTPQRMFLRVKVRTIWPEEGVELVEIRDEDLVLGPFGSTEIHVDEIKVDRDHYEEVGSGKIKLRCTATALEAGVGWEKGRRLAEHTTIFYLQEDPGYGLFDEVLPVPMGPDKPRSKAVPTAGTKSWRLEVNTEHPAFRNVDQDDDLRTDYYFEESARQAAYVLLHKGQDDVLLRILGLDKRANQIEEMESEEVVSVIAYPFADRLLAKYYG